ncbi:hypothetical protein [Myxococcus stipitatus]|nr:hypothetical protein [Myxococcus stipitatus]
MRTVELTEEEKKEGLIAFKKFEAIGDSAFGTYLGKETKTKTFRAEEGPKQITEYFFWNSKDGEFSITPPLDLERQLKKAMKPESEGGFGLKPFDGRHPHLCKMTHNAVVPTNSSSMKLFKLGVDTSPEIPAEIIAKIPVRSFAGTPAPAPTSAGQTQRPPPPPDDIPF